MPSSSARASRRNAISRGADQARLCARRQHHRRHAAFGSSSSNGGPPLCPVPEVCPCQHPSRPSPDLCRRAPPMPAHRLVKHGRLGKAPIRLERMVRDPPDFDPLTASIKPVPNAAGLGIQQQQRSAGTLRAAASTFVSRRRPIPWRRTEEWTSILPISARCGAFGWCANVSRAVAISRLPASATKGAWHRWQDQESVRARMPVHPRAKIPP